MYRYVLTFHVPGTLDFPKIVLRFRGLGDAKRWATKLADDTGVEFYSLSPLPN